MTIKRVDPWGAEEDMLVQANSDENYYWIYMPNPMESNFSDTFDMFLDWCEGKSIEWCHTDRRLFMRAISDVVEGE